MSEANIQNCKNDFIELYTQNIKRAGSQELLDWIEKSDFFTAPASSKYHNNFEGGLCLHSINVYKQLVHLLKSYGLENRYSAESVAIVSLLHDLCKTYFYKKDLKNVKNEQGQWVKTPYYAIDEKMPFGHGEKSVFIIERFMRLEYHEALAIRWHMGGFDDSVKGGSYSVSAAYEQNKLALLVHLADMAATYLFEKKV